MASRSGAGYLALLLAVVLLWSHGAACAPDQAPLTIITEEWPPYNYAEDGQLKGVSVEIVKTVLKELGRSDPIQLYPSQRAKKMQDALPRTIFFSLFRTKEREPLYKWIGPIGFDAIYFYKRKGDPIEINSLDDARRVPRIACRQAGLVHDILEKEGFTNLDTNAHSSQQIYFKLLKGRSNLAISDSPLGVKYFLQKEGLPPDSLTQTKLMVVSSDLYIAGSLDLPDSEVDQWRQALLRLRDNGTIEKIYREYH